MNRSSISWLKNADGSPGYTWSPTSGCGPGLPCYERCWARAYHVRYRGGDFSVKLHPEKLDEPLRLRKPSTIGVCLMGDLGHEEVPDSFIRQVFRTALSASCHRFLFLTKRPAKLRPIVDRFPQIGMPSSGFWIGVSVDTRESLSRVDRLREIASAHRWISLEPQIEDVGRLDLRGISWLVQGCESGPRRRPFDVAWARSVRDQCKAAGVPFFLKQMWNKKMPELDGQQWLEFPKERIET
jgi:protein gp37